MQSQGELLAGTVRKRCSCTPEYGANGRRKACPKRHGSWEYVVDLPPVNGKRQQVRKGGFATKAEAEDELRREMEAIKTGARVNPGRLTVADFLRSWLTTKEAAGIRPTTLLSYRSHVDRFLIPTLGHLLLRDLRGFHVEAMLRQVVTANADRMRTIGPTSQRRIIATLSSALASARRQRLVMFNAAADVELPRAFGPKVQLWSPAQLGAFLDHVATDRLGPVFEVLASTGMRRGEVLGMRWSDVDLDRGRIVVRQQLLSVSGRPRFGPPKTASGEARTVDLDSRTIGVLLTVRLSQDAERATWGAAYNDHGLVFAREDGSPLDPGQLTKRFVQLAADAGLPRARLHDLRHASASLMIQAGVPLALVSKRLGHSSISITSDIYGHMLEGAGREAAERAAALVPRKSHDGHHLPAAISPT
jgi:integrase